jgi:type IV pilus assembly protein PilQ
MTGVALLWLGGCTQVWAVPALQEVKVNPLLADQLLLELSFSEPVSGFTDRLTYEPNQLLLHVPGAIGALTVNPLPIKQQGVNNLLVEGKGQGLDIKIALDQLTPYQVHQQGNKLLVALGDKAGQPVASSAAPVAASQSALVRSQPVTQSALIDTQRVAQNQSQYQAQPAMAATPTVAPSPVALGKPVLSVSQANMGGAYFNSVKGVDFRRGKEGQGSSS